jgi:hypothetical protein
LPSAARDAIMEEPAYLTAAEYLGYRLKVRGRRGAAQGAVCGAGDALRARRMRAPASRWRRAAPAPAPPGA